MKITNGAFVRKSLAVFSAAISLIAFISCGEDTGLGSTIDTEAPKIAISYPNPKVSNVVKDTFVLAGTCTDDKAIARVEVAVTNLDTQKSYGTFPATVNALSNTWSVDLNSFDASNEDNCNGWPFPDGNYKFVATAYDNAGHSTQDSSSLEIDNTAPLVVLTSPGSTTTATEYGSSFYVEGTIAEEHTVSSLKVTIYDDSGNALGETDVTPYIENDIATAGGTNVSFMKFSTGSSALKERYKEIYGDNENAGTKNYTCAIYVSDNAKEFKNPNESTSDDSGNETSVFYLYSDVYKTLMSANGYGLTAADLMRIINGTYTASDDDSSRTATTSSDSGLLTKAQLAEVKAILSKKGQYGYDSEKSKATDTSENHLKFSLNPKVNPTYTISGLLIEEGSKSYPSGTKNQTITFILSPGLDGTAIEAATVKAYLLKYKPVAEVNEKGLSEGDYSTFLGDPENFESDQKTEVNLSKKYDPDTMLTSLTATFKLPEIVANYFYIIALSGVDADQHELVPDGLFGFVGALSGTPPSVTIETPISQSIIGDSKDVTFTGKVVTTEVKLESLAIEIDVSNVETGDTLTTENNKITASGSGKDGDSVTWGEPVYDATSAKYTYEWTCNLKDCENYSEFSAEAKSEHIYSYAATVKATDTSGNTNTTSRTISVDTVPPKITINSILPSVTDYTDATHTDKDAVYANGSITVSGSIEEMNLKSASYTVLVNGETVKKDGGEPDEKYTDVTIYSQFKITIDTTKLTDDSDFKIVIAAEDRANSSNNSLETELSGDNTIKGNYTSYSTAEYYAESYDKDQVPFKILQETDRPVISLTNADASITTLEGIVAATENIFEKSGKLTATITDDDGVNFVSASIRKLGSTEEFGESLPGKYTSSNNMFSATLPDTVGDYEIKLYVVDSVGTLPKSSNSINFAIAIDDGVPTFSNVQPGTTGYYNETISVSGKVSDESGIVTLKISDSKNGTSAKYSEENTLEKNDDGIFTFSDRITVPDESNTYTVTYIATDKYGKSRSYPIQYIVDRIYPKFKDGSFAIGNLKDGFLVSTSPKVTISAKDEGSGIAAVKAFVGTTEVSLSGADVSDTDGYTEYTGYLSLKEGENSVLLSVTDKAENSTQTEVFSFIVDTIDPMVSAPVVSSNLINKASYDEADFTGITISSTVGDTGSGVSKIWLGTTKTTSYKDATYKSELSENQTASSLTGDQCAVSLSIPKADLSDGNYTYYLFAMDKAERSTVSTAIQFTVDTTPPVIEVSNLEENAVYTERDVTDFDSSARTAKYKVSGTWLDEIKGTESLEYSTDGGNTWTKVTGVQSAAGVTMSWASTIEVKESTGNTLSFRAKDLAGNTSAVTTYSGLIFDFSAPSITISGTVPEQTKDSVTVAGFVSDSLAIEEIAIKAVKGNLTIPAIFTENTKGKDYSYSLEISASSENNGTWTVSFEATDVAGQKTTLATRTILIDNTAPVVGDSAVSTTGSTTDSGVTYFNSTYPLSITTSVTDSVGTISEVEYAAYSGKLTSVIGSGTAVIDWSQLSLISGVYTGTASGFINANDGKGIEDGDYTIFIRAKDTVGNVSEPKAIHLVADKTAPVFSVTSDTGKSIITTEGIGTYFEKGSFTIEGSLSESNLESLTYTLNGCTAQALSLSENAWSISSGTIPEEGGTFAYIITAKDKVGSVATVKRTVTIDKIAPEVSVDDWKDSTNTFIVTNKNSSTVTFSGNVSDENGGSGLASVEVYYGTESTKSTVNPDSMGKWTCTFTEVPAGDHTLHVVATDNAGNEKHETKAFGVDLEKPKSTLNVTGTIYDNSTNSPVALDSANNLVEKWNDNITYIAKENFTLSGTVSDKAFRAKNVRLTVKKDGGAETTVISSTAKENALSSLDWTYTQTVPTEEGDHTADGVYTYKLTATDDAGNSADYSFIVRVDTTAPTINISAPTSGTNFKYVGETGKANISISGTAFDNGAGAYKVYYDIKKNGVSILKANESDSDKEASFVNETWSNASTISTSEQGNLTLHITAEDYLGNKSVKTVDFVCDSLPPVITSEKVNGAAVKTSYYNSALIDLSANVSDAVSEIGSVTYTLNGGAAKTMSLTNGAYVASVICDEGENTIVISASDANGNTTSGDEVKTLTFKVDSVAPSFVATSVSSTESNADVTVRGTITEAQGLLSTNGLKVTATKDGEPVTNETLLNAIQPTYTADSALSGSAWNFTLTADTTNHSTDGSWVFTITAKDVAGNESTTTASVLIDTVAPTLNNIAATVSYEKPSTTDSITYFNGSKPLFLSIITKDNEGGVGLDNVEYNIVSGHKTEWADTFVTTNSSWNSLSKSNSTDTPADTWKTTIISDFADLDDGAYTIFVRSSDKLGNKKYSTPLLLVNDQTVPTLTESTTVNSNYTAYKESSATNATLSGNVNDKNEDESFAGYFASLTYTLTADISIEETVKSGTITPGANGDWSLTTPNFDTTTGGTFTYNFTAIDKAGNKAEVRRIIIQDLEKPVVEISSLNTITDLAASNTVNSSNCTFKGTAKDNIELKEVYAYIRANSESAPTAEWIASNKKSFTTDSEHSWEVTFSNVTENWYTLYVVAKDSAGNEKTETQVFGVDNAAPTTSLTLTANKVKAMSGTSSYDLDASGNYTISGVANKASWDDGVTYIASETFRIGGVVTEKFDFTADDIKLYVNKETTEITKSEISTNETTGVKTLTWYYEQTVSSTEGESDGLYTYKLEATDASGNSQTYQFIVRIDTLGPSTTILSPASGAGINGSSFEISGTASDVGTGVASVTYKIYKISDTSNETLLLVSDPDSFTNGRWTATVKDISEGNLRLEATSIDYLGHPSKATPVEFYYDSTAPSLSKITATALESGNTQYNTNSSIEIGVTAEDDVSGVANVTYKIGIGGASRAMTLSNGSYVGWPTFTETGTYTIYVDAVDKQNNSTASGETPTSKTKTIEISVDADAPNLDSSSVKIDDSAVQETYYTNGKSDITISGTVTDIGSGIKSVTILPYEKNTTDKITAKLGTSTTAGGVTSMPFSKAIDKSKITKSGTVYALIEDKAGNTTYVNLVALTYDEQSPNILNPILEEKTANFKAYKTKDANGKEFYYVNNGQIGSTGTTPTYHTFKLSGVATDNLGLSKITLSITDGTTTLDTVEIVDNPATTDKDELADWNFDNIDLHTLTGDNTKATLTLYDKAGNKAESTISIKYDTGAPTGLHDTDTAGKDYTFRIGDGIGGKYYPGTYGNNTTIMIRGYFTESLSGLSMLYYKVLQSPPTQAKANTFLANYTDGSTGFAALSSEKEATVSSSASGDKTVKSNFETTVSSFQEGKNYLLLVAVDNVGNAALDTASIGTDDDVVTGCYSINVDVKAPEAEASDMNAHLTNGKSDIVITGTAKDNPSTGASGIKSIVVSLTVDGTEYKSSDATPKITVGPNTDVTGAVIETTDDSTANWKATISKDLFAADTLTSGNFTVYATVTDNAGEKGNSQTSNIGTISVDKILNEVVLTAPTDADKTTTSVREINGTIDLSGTVKDDNPLSDTAIVGIQYALASTTPSSTSDEGWTTLTNTAKTAAHGEMKTLSLTGNYTFSIKNFDTTKIEPLNDVAYYIRAKAQDKAGNIGYSDAIPVTISQDSDRPVVKIVNLAEVTGGTYSYILKYGTKSQVIATVEDDDGIDKIYISETAYTGTETEPTTSVYVPTTGTLTFTPSEDTTANKNVDGEKKFYVYVKDTAGKEFYTTYRTKNTVTNYLNVPKLKVNDTALTDTANASQFTYFSDSTSPEVGIVYALAYKAGADANTAGVVNGGKDTSETADETNPYTEYEAVNASYVIGGTERQWLQFKIPVSDASGISGIYMEISYKDKSDAQKTIKRRTATTVGTEGSVVATDTFVAAKEDDGTTDSKTTKIWTTDKISLADANGNISLKIIPYDASGLQGNGQVTFVADTTGPEIKVTSPESTDEVTGTVSVVGISTDQGGSKTSSTKWLIPTRTQRKMTDDNALYTATKDLWLDTGFTAKSTASSWTFELKASEISAYDTDGSDNTSGSDGGYAQSVADGVYILPFYVLSTDELGNRTIKRDYTIKHNPDNDRPKTTISYPDQSGRTLGGTIRVTGESIIPAGEATVKAVYLQIGTVTGGVASFGEAAKTKASSPVSLNDNSVNIGGYAYAVKESADVKTDNGFASDLNFGSAGNSTDWWGIPVTKTSSAWNFSLNANGELDPASGDTNHIAIRACAVNSEGKVGAWSATYFVDIDSTAPTQIATLRQFASSGDNAFSTTDIDSNLPATKAVAIRSYEAEMYLKGDWYLTVQLDDESQLDSYSVKKGNQTLESGYYASSKKWTFSKDGEDDKTFTGETLTSETNNDTGETVQTLTTTIGETVETVTIPEGFTVKSVTRTLFIPVDKTDEKVDYTVIVTDSNEAGGHTINAVYSLRIDEVAPTITKIYNGSDSEKSASLAEDYTVNDENYIFTLGGKVTENGSGFERVVFYYVRENDNSKTYNRQAVLDPLVKSETGTADSKAYLYNESSTTVGTDDTTSAILTKRTFSQDSTHSYDLWALAVTGTMKADGYTFEAGSSLADNKHIRNGGLIEVGGVLRRIESISGTTVVFDSNTGVTADTDTTAYFPYAQVVDNTNTEKTESTSANPFTFQSGDDGDLMPETVSGSKSTGYLWDSSVHTTNIPDGPAKLVVLVFDKAGNVSGATYTVKVENSAPRLAKVFLGTDLNSNDSWQANEFVGYDLYNADETHGIGTTEVKASQTIQTASYGSAFTIKDKLAVVAEIVGGNGEIIMVYGKDATAATAVPSTGTGRGVSATADTTIPGLITATDKIGSVTYNKKTVTTSLKGFTLTSNQVVGLAEGGTIAESNDGTGKKASFTFWDSTEELTKGSTSQNCVLYVTDFAIDLHDGLAPTTVINPFYWQNLNSNSIYGSGKQVSGSYTTTSFSDLQGHIELEADWTATDSNNNYLSQYDGNTSGTALDADPKVSGKITFTGTAYDEHALSKLEFSFGDAFTNKEIAHYDKTESIWVKSAATMASDGYEVTIETDAKDSKGNSAVYGVFEDTAYFDQKGHKLYWTLSIDTARITKVAEKDVKLTVFATDLAGRTTETTGTGVIKTPVKSTGYIPGQELSSTVKYTVTDGTTNYPIYQMDVVPYITKVLTNLSNQNEGDPEVYSRTARGHYPVASNESSVELRGFNLAANSANITLSGISSLPTGQYAYTVNEIESINNKNNNASHGVYDVSAEGLAEKTKVSNMYNRQPNTTNNLTLTDDVYFDMWELNPTAAIPTDGALSEPVMKINPATNMIGFAFASGTSNFCMPNNNTSYTHWQKSYDYYTSIGLTYDSNGYSYGVAAGADCNDHQADLFNFLSSRWGVGTPNAKGGSSDGNHALRLESVGQNFDKNGNGKIDKIYNPATDELYIDKKRIQSPSLATGASTANDTNVYLAYYDNINDEIRFRSGNITNNNSDNGNRTLTDDYSSNEMNNNDNIPNRGGYNSDKSQIIANKDGSGTLGKAGNFVSIAVVNNADTNNNDYVVMVWYDQHSKKLYYAYNTNPLAGTIGVNTTNWTGVKQVLSSGGEYCQIAVDKDGGIHIAAYDNGKLKYAHLDKFNSTTVKTCTVDSYDIIGQNLTLDVAYEVDENGVGHNIPHIGYYALSRTLPKYAYLAKPDSEDLNGADSSNFFTGVWESTYIPTQQTVPQDRINVGVFKNNGVRAYSTINKEANGTRGTSTTSAGSGTCYGNGTNNPVIGYAIRFSSNSTYAEVAQKK